MLMAHGVGWPMPVMAFIGIAHVSINDVTCYRPSEDNDGGTESVAPDLLCSSEK